MSSCSLIHLVWWVSMTILTWFDNLLLPYSPGLMSSDCRIHLAWWAPSCQAWPEASASGRICPVSWQCNWHARPLLSLFAGPERKELDDQTISSMKSLLYIKLLVEYDLRAFLFKSSIMLLLFWGLFSNLIPIPVRRCPCVKKNGDGKAYTNVCKIREKLDKYEINRMTV